MQIETAQLKFHDKRITLAKKAYQKRQKNTENFKQIEIGFRKKIIESNSY